MAKPPSLETRDNECYGDNEMVRRLASQPVMIRLAKSQTEDHPMQIKSVGIDLRQSPKSKPCSQRTVRFVVHWLISQSHPRLGGGWSSKRTLLCYNFETVVPPKFATQMLAPSKATPSGSLPTLNVPRVAPVLAFNFVTVAPLKSATQMFPPS